MSWAFDFDEDDCFLPIDFGEGMVVDQSLIQTDMGVDEPKELSSFFYLPERPSISGSERGAADVFEARADTESNAVLVDQHTITLSSENAELRRAAMTLRERFGQIASLNENLKNQLDQCRSRFKNLMFTEFGPRK
jgi:hypothetical protein